RIIQQSLRPTYRHCTRALKKKAKCMRQDALDPTGSFVPALEQVFGYKVCSEIPPRRISSTGGTSISACFRTATVCSTLNCFLFHRESPFLGCYIGVETNLRSGSKKTGAFHSEAQESCSIRLAIAFSMTGIIPVLIS